MRIFGLMFFAVGLVLLAFGFNASHSLTEQVVEGVSGKYTDDTMLYILGGVAMLIGGGALAISGKSK